jgi:hypothetical protein
MIEDLKKNIETIFTLTRKEKCLEVEIFNIKHKWLKCKINIIIKIIF